VKKNTKSKSFLMRVNLQSRRPNIMWDDVEKLVRVFYAR